MAILGNAEKRGMDNSAVSCGWRSELLDGASGGLQLTDRSVMYS
ncbi:hypothetical protein [Piscinibacter terrae]|nr:hypothetical protein [Albitalea terrae]